MTDSDSDQLPELVFSSDSEEDAPSDYPPECIHKGKEWSNQFEDIIKIRILSPFLFACQFGDDVWNQLLLNMGLLKQDWLSTNEVANPMLSKAVDLMEEIADSVIITLVSVKKRALAHSLLQTLKNNNNNNIASILPDIRENQLIFQLRKRVNDVIDETDRDQLTAGLLYACHQYDLMVEEASKTDAVKVYCEKIKEQNTTIDDLKRKGNVEFSNGEYVKAIGFYTAGLMRSPFNHVLYANRSQAYLSDGSEDWLAVMDARRSIVLDKTYEKAYLRCAYAWQKLNNYEQTLKILLRAEKLGIDQKNILPYKAKVQRILNGKNGGPKNSSLPNGDHNEKKGTRICRLTSHERYLRDSVSDSNDDNEPNVLNYEENLVREVTQPRPRKKSKNQVKEVAKAVCKDPNSMGLDRTMANTNTNGAATSVSTNNKSRDTRQKKSESDNYRPPYEGPGPGNRTPVTDIQSAARQGSHYLLDDQPHRAVQSYIRALEATKGLSPATLLPDFSPMDHSVLKYALGSTYIKCATTKDIQEAVKVFVELVDNLVDIKLPMAHYGLGQAYFLQTRFDESKKQFKKGLGQVHQQKKVCWPSSKTEIDESDNSILKKKFCYWIASCQNPPKPDAVCRLGKKPGHMNINIYINDPDIKGFVRVNCYASCIIEYHLDCWKKIISDDVKKTSDKELINSQCNTPDCAALISAITIYDSEGLPKRRVSGSKLPGETVPNKALPRIRMKPSNKTIEKRRERKARRKLRRQEARDQREQETSNIVQAIEDLENRASPLDEPAAVQPLVLPPDADIEKYATVLKKEEDDEATALMAARAMKTKKKKDRSKKVMSLGEFVGNQGDEDEDEVYDWDGEDYDVSQDTYIPQDASMGIDNIELPSQTKYSQSAAEQPSYPVLDQDNPFTVPDYLRDSIEAFERTLGHRPPTESSQASVYTDHPQVYSQPMASLQQQTISTQPTPPTYNIPPEPRISPLDLDTNTSTSQDDNIKDFLFTFFAGVLKEHGPLNIDDVVIKRELDEFPINAIQLIEAAGGLGQFLSHNIQFAMVEDFICLVEDEPKARQLAQENKKTLVDKYRQELALSMAVIPGKSKKRRGKKASREAYSDIPRKVDLKEEDQISERSWADSETSGTSETSSVSRTSKSIPPFNLNELLMYKTANSEASISSSLSDLGQITEKDRAPFTNGNKMADNRAFLNKSSGETMPSTDNSVLQSGYTAGSVCPALSIPSGSVSDPLSQEAPSASNGNNAAGKQINSKPHILDTLSDDENYSGRTSDTSSVSNKRDMDQNEGLDYTSSGITGAISSPFMPISVNEAQPSKLDQLWNSPIEFSSQAKSASSKTNKRKKNRKNVKAKETEENSPASSDNLAKEYSSNSSDHVNKSTPEHPPITSFTQVSRQSPAMPVFSQSPQGIITVVSSPGSQQKQLSSASLPSHTHPIVSSPVSPFTPPPPFSMPISNMRPGSVGQPAFIPPMGVYMGPTNIPPPSFPQRPATIPPPPILAPKDSMSLGGSLPTFPPLSPAQLIGQSGSGRSVIPSPSSSISSQGAPSCFTRDKGLQTEPLAMDWTEVEALMRQLEQEKQQLAEKLESERRQRMELAREQGEQMEQIIQQMQHQEEKNHIVEKQRDQYCHDRSARQDEVIHLRNKITSLEDKCQSSQAKHSNLEKEVAELKHVIEKDRTVLLQEREEYNSKLKSLSEKYGMDMVRAERSEIDLLKLKLALSMKNFEKSSVHAEREKDVYSEHITRLEAEGIGAPPELVDVYRNWSRVLEDIRNKQELCKNTFEDQMRQIKRGEKLYNLPCLEIADPPPVPVRSNAKSEQAHARPRVEPPGRLAQTSRQSPVFNAAPGSRPGLYGPRGTMPFGMPLPGNSRRGQKKNNFEKIMRSLSSMFPNYRGTDIKQFILRLRESRGNTLTGITLQEIVTSVAGLIVEDSQSRMINQGVSIPPPSASPWTPRTSLSVGNVTAEEIFEEEEDPCVICHEELAPESLLKVECGHRFHDQCIRRWMQEQSTCPTCRKHFLLKEDFPSLS